MSRRAAVFLTATLTAFVLVVAVAVAVRLGTAPGGSEQKALASAREATIPLRVVLQREQRYRQRLEEANARLNWAYRQIRTLQGELAKLSAQAQGYTRGMEEASTMGMRWREEEWKDEERHERDGRDDD